MAESTFSVPELHCEGCENAIRDELKDAPGVRRVEVDLPGRRVTVEYNAGEASTDTLGGHIREAGFACSCEDDEREAAPAPKPATNEVRPAKKPAAEAEPRRGLWYALLALGLALLAVAGYIGYELYPRFDLPAAQGAGLLFLAAGAGIALGGGALFEGVTFTSGAGMTIRAVVGALLILLGLVQLGVLPSPLHAVEAVSRPPCASRPRRAARARRRASRSSASATCSQASGERGPSWPVWPDTRSPSGQ